MSDTRTRLARCFQAVFPNLKDAELDRASIETISAWDSVAMVNLVATAEEEFGVDLLDNVESLVSFQAFLDCLKRSATN